MNRHSVSSFPGLDSKSRRDLRDLLMRWEEKVPILYLYRKGAKYDASSIKSKRCDESL